MIEVLADHTDPEPEIPTLSLADVSALMASARTALSRIQEIELTAEMERSRIDTWVENATATDRKHVAYVEAQCETFMRARQLTYKGQWYRSDVISVPAQYSSQECSACGHVAKENRPSQAVFRCVSCGHGENADVNASKVIRQRGIELSAAQGRCVDARGVAA